MAEATFNNFNDLIRGGNIIEAGLMLSTIRDHDLKLRWIHEAWQVNSFQDDDSADAKLLKLVQASALSWFASLNYLLIQGNVFQPEKMYKLVLDYFLRQLLDHPLVCFLKVNRASSGLILSCAVQFYANSDQSIDAEIAGRYF